jgi:hypothetical protein
MVETGAKSTGAMVLRAGAIGSLCGAFIALFALVCAFLMYGVFPEPFFAACFLVVLTFGLAFLFALVRFLTRRRWARQFR